MPNYTCPRCLYIAEQKIDITRHFRRKNQCKLSANGIDIKPLDYESLITGDPSSVLKLMRKTFKLEEEIKKLKAQIQSITITGDHNNINNINNININNPKIVINVTSWKDSHYEYLSNEDYKLCINRMIMSVPELIKRIHFNPKHPENHNIYISNLRNNLAMTYDGNQWNIYNQERLINDLIKNNEMILEEWVECGEDKYPKAMKKFKMYLEKKTEDGVEDQIKEEIKFMLYNNRNMIKNTTLKI